MMLTTNQSHNTSSWTLIRLEWFLSCCQYEEWINLLSTPNTERQYRSEYIWHEVGFEWVNNISFPFLFSVLICNEVQVYRWPICMKTIFSHPRTWGQRERQQEIKKKKCSRWVWLALKCLWGVHVQMVGNNKVAYYLRNSGVCACVCVQENTHTHTQKQQKKKQQYTYRSLA